FRRPSVERENRAVESEQAAADDGQSNHDAEHRGPSGTSPDGGPPQVHGTGIGRARVRLKPLEGRFRLPKIGEALSWPNFRPEQEEAGAYPLQKSHARAIEGASVAGSALRAARHAAAAGPLLARRPAAVRDPEDPHRLQPQAQLLAAVGGPD